MGIVFLPFCHSLFFFKSLAFCSVFRPRILLCLQRPLSLNLPVTVFTVIFTFFFLSQERWCSEVLMIGSGLIIFSSIRATNVCRMAFKPSTAAFHMLMKCRSRVPQHWLFLSRHFNWHALCAYLPCISHSFFLGTGFGCQGLISLIVTQKFGNSQKETSRWAEEFSPLLHRCGVDPLVFGSGFWMSQPTADLVSRELGGPSVAAATTAAAVPGSQ